MATQRAGERAVLVTGTVGAGKTTTAEAIGDLLRGAGIPHAVIDLDRLRDAWPSPADDPFHLELTLQNLAAVARNFRAAGHGHLVLAGVVEDPLEQRRIQRAVGVPLVVCRLRVDLERVRARLAARDGTGSQLDWDLGRCGELDRILDANGVGEVIVDVDAEGAADVAERILTAIGWSGTSG